MTIQRIFSVGGTATWKFVNPKPGMDTPFRSSGLLVARSGQRFGGCIRVGKDWILTAHHLVDVAAMARSFTASFGRFTPWEANIHTYELDPTDYFASDDGIQGASGFDFRLDYAFIRLKGGNNDISTNPLPQVIPAPPAVGDLAIIPQYLSRGPMQVASPCSVELQYAGMFTSINADFTYHLTSTIEGSSGSPIFDEKHRLVAMHTHGQHPWDRVGLKRKYNWGTRIDAIVHDARSRGFAFLNEMPELNRIP